MLKMGYMKIRISICEEYFTLSIVKGILVLFYDRYSKLYFSSKIEEPSGLVGRVLEFGVGGGVGGGWGRRVTCLMRFTRGNVLWP